MAKTAKEPVKLNLRLEEDLHFLLVKAAKENHRSLQTEIVSRLEGTFMDVPPRMMKLILRIVHAAAHSAARQTATRLAGEPPVPSDTEVEQMIIGFDQPKTKRKN